MSGKSYISNYLSLEMKIVKLIQSLLLIDHACAHSHMYIAVVDHT